MRRRRALLAAALALACGPREAPPANFEVVSIRYPREGDVVDHDEIPLWLGAPDPAIFEHMSLQLNGDDITRDCLPWGPRWLVEEPEVVCRIRPQPGRNTLLVRVAADGQHFETAAHFRQRPRERAVTVRVLEAGRDVPARISVRGLDGTPDPILAPPVWQRIAPDRQEHLRGFAYGAGEPVRLRLPRGRYEVFASRGPAYSLARGEIDDDTRELTLEIERVMRTEGWVSADFHVHALPSEDSSLPLRERVESYRAQDVDVIVASDHHTISDYRADLGDAYSWPEDFSAVPGTEVRLRDLGHWNFWPLARDDEPGPLAYGSWGAPSYGAWERRDIDSVSELYAHYRALNQEARRRRFGDVPVVAQLNHPRGLQFAPFGSTYRFYAFLEGIGYEPGRPLSNQDNGRLLERPRPDLPRPVDVDAIELLNRLAYGLYLETRRDWFAWMREGVVATGTANTDSHWLVIPEAGFPRNWVRTGGGVPVAAGALARAVRARQVVGTTGPLVVLEPWPPDGTPLRGPLERLSIEVRAPAWMPLAEARVFVNGERVRRLSLGDGPPAPDPLAAEQQVRRLEVPLALHRDGFVVVEVGDAIPRLLSPQPHAGPLGRIFPHLRVLAFTNALLVDADADGALHFQ